MINGRCLIKYLQKALGAFHSEPDDEKYPAAHPGTGSFKNQSKFRVLGVLAPMQCAKATTVYGAIGAETHFATAK